MTDDKKSNPRFSGFADDGRPNLLMKTEDLGGLIDGAMDALFLRADNIYQRSGRILQLIRHDAVVTPADDDTGAAPRRPQGTLIIEDVGTYRLLELLAASAAWWKWDKRAKRKPRANDGEDAPTHGDWVKSRPTLDHAKHIQERLQWPFRVLAGATEAPTIRRDGSVLQVPGYDEASRIFFDPNGVDFPTIAEEPTFDDARAALALLKNVIRLFPFVPDREEDWGGPSAARSVALSAMLTGMMRRSLPTAPAHAITAPTPGTGKTKVAEIVAALVMGRKPTAISYGKSQEEFEKRLFAVLRAGDLVVVIDNIEADAVASDEFCTVLTSETIQGRILGQSQMANLPTSSLFILNGNNIRFKGDITARVVVGAMDARMEDPKSRRFDFDPVQYTLEHRPELVTAALTILRAHAVAGYPGHADLSPSRFPDWDRMVRGALVWLGEPDPQATGDNIRSEDPERDAHLALMRGWRDLIGPGVHVTAQHLMDSAMMDTLDDVRELEAKLPFHFADPFAHEYAPPFLDALMAALATKGNGRVGVRRDLSAQGIGIYLAKFNGRIFDGLSLHVHSDQKRGNSYWLEAN